MKRLGFSCMLFGAVVSAQSVLSIRENHISSEIRIVKETAFTISNLEQLALAFLKDRRFDKLAQMYVVTDKSYISHLLGSLSTETTYESMIHAGTEMPVFAVARVLLRDGSAVLEVRQAGTGLLTRRVLRGSDPRQVRSGTRTYELVWAIVAPANAEERLRFKQSVSVALFLCIDEVPSPKQSLAVWRAVSKSLGVQSMYLSIRRQPFFVNGNFPQVYPFGAVDVSVAAEEYLAEPQIDCYINERELQCHSSNGSVSKSPI